MATVGGREMHIDHLDRRQFFQDGPRGQPGGELAGPELQSHLQAIGDEGDEDVGFDPVVQLMVDRP